MRYVWAALLGSVLGLLPAHASAQAITSPYEYIETRHSAGLYGGYIDTDPGRFDMAPRSATIFGGRYGIRLAGPISGELGMAFGSTDRTVYIPTAPGSDEPLVAAGETNVVLMLGEAGIRFDLTGQRTWRGLAPFAIGTIGFAADLTRVSEAEATLPDSQIFEFGPSFAASLGLGSNFFLTEQVSIRFDVRDYLWRLNYPAGLTGTDRTENEWRHNFAILLGGSFHF